MTTSNQNGRNIRRRQNREARKQQLKSPKKPFYIQLIYILLDKLLVKIKLLFSKLSLKFYLLVGCVVICIGSFLYSTCFRSGYINGNVVFAGNISLSYNTPQVPEGEELSMSPLSGGIFRKPRRGVEFCSKSFKIHPNFSDTSSFNQFFISSPTENMLPDPHFNFKTDIYIFKGKVHDDVKKEFLTYYYSGRMNISERLSSKIVYHKTLDSTAFLALHGSKSSLNVDLLSEYPIAALIPQKNSTINVFKEPSSNFKNGNNFDIQEIFSADKDENSYELPMIDVLGPKILLNSKPKSISYNEEFLELSLFGEDITCLIMLEVGFTARISISPSSDKMEKSMDSIRGPLIDYTAGGEIMINPIPLNDLEFKSLKNRLDTTYIFHSLEKLPGSNISAKFWALPRLTNHNGIYFFGENLSRIACDEAIGICQFNEEEISLSPSRNIEISELENFVFNDDPIITPINYNKSSLFDSKFRGNGELKINGEHVSKNFLDSDIIKYLSIIVGLISGLIGVVEIINLKRLNINEEGFS
ncbi:MAG: hypothetical protein V4663_05105 [Bacteroidota bacterium]